MRSGCCGCCQNKGHILPGGGAGYIQVGSEFFVMYWGGGGEKKNPSGQRGGGAYISSGILCVCGGGGCRVRCVPLVFAFIKSQSFWGGQAPQTPTDAANNIKYSKVIKRLQNNSCKKKSRPFTFSLCAFDNTVVKYRLRSVIVAFNFA